MGCVYFFKHNNSKYVKVGMSKKDTPDDRFKSFLTYAPLGGEILGYISTSKPSFIESEIHDILSQDRVYGEWFDVDFEQIEQFIYKYNEISDVKRLLLEIPFDLSEENKNYKYLKILEVLFRRAHLNINNVEYEYLIKLIRLEKNHVDTFGIDIVSIYNNHFLKDKKINELKNK